MDITWLPVVQSTNDEIKQAISDSRPEGTAIAAFAQEGGYGRQGRQWSSPLGGLYLSILFRPLDKGMSPDQLPTFSLVVSLAARTVLGGLVPEEWITIKWPNDVLLNGGKVAGISVELIEGALCVGIGINVFEPGEGGTFEDETLIQEKYQRVFIAPFLDNSPLNTQAALPVLDTGQSEFIKKLAESLLYEVYSRYEQWLGRGFSPLRDEYLECLSLSGQTVQLLSLSDEVFHKGTVCDIDELGRLVLKTEKGDIVRASSGEVHLL